MMVIINPGSHIPSDPAAEGWTNTYEGALAEAEKWLHGMRGEGLADIEMTEPASKDPIEGRWTFGFRHTVTGVTVELDTHGIAPLDVYMRDRFAHPRVYWNGSSTSDPELSQWAAPGYVQTYRKKQQ